MQTKITIKTFENGYKPAGTVKDYKDAFYIQASFSGNIFVANNEAESEEQRTALIELVSAGIFEETPQKYMNGTKFTITKKGKAVLKKEIAALA